MLRITHQGILSVPETGRVLRLLTEENLRKYIRAQTALRPVSVNGARRGDSLCLTGAQKTRLRYEDLICR
jgi:hypothetical protein